MDLYAENILDHYRHPRGQEPLANPSAERREENLSCGDELTVRLELKGGVISGVSWEGTGCAISQAAMSLLSEELTGMTTDDLTKMKPERIYELLGVPVGPRRFKCALLCLHTLKNALRVHDGKEPQGWLETVALDND